MLSEAAPSQVAAHAASAERSENRITDLTAGRVRNLVGATRPDTMTPAELRQLIRHAQVLAEQTLEALPGHVTDLFELGAGQAMQEARGRTNGESFLDELTEYSLLDVESQRITGTRTAVTVLISTAEKLLRDDDPAGVIDALSKAANTMERTVRTAANHAINAGVTETCMVLDQARMWVPELDACVHCAAYAGRIAEPGDAFPTGLTFDTVGHQPVWPDGVLISPPRHPYCRCRLMPADERVSVALHREAQRAIAYGYARPTESEAARRRAAERMLREGSVLPQSVVARARKWLRKSAFARPPATGSGIPKPFREREE